MTNVGCVVPQRVGRHMPGKDKPSRTRDMHAQREVKRHNMETPSKKNVAHRAQDEVRMGSNKVLN
jgi:hypothetical protein